MSRIIVGIVAYNFDNSLFISALETIEPYADEIHIIYGRFKDFNLFYAPCPEWLKKYNLTIVDNLFSQHEQRDLYLNGIEDGDILIVMDSDWVPVSPDFDMFFEKLKRNKNWDSALISVPPGGPTVSTGTSEQKLILIYRYRKGWRHSKGQVLRDEENKMIASPDYNVIKIPSEEFYFSHFPIKYNDSDYLHAQLNYWESVKNI